MTLISLIALALTVTLVRYLWVFKLPCHGDLGYFVDPRCVQDRRYHFKGTMVTYLLGCFRIFSCWFYQTAWIIAGSYWPFKKVKNIMSSLLIVLSGIAVYRVAEQVGISPGIAYLFWLLVTADFVWGGYVTTADKLVMCFIPVVLYYWFQGNYLLAFLLIAIDVFMNKPVGVFIYGPLTVYTLYLHPTQFFHVILPLLTGLVAWNLWLAYNDNSMSLALRTISPLNRSRTYAKETPAILYVYARKFKVLLHQIVWAPVIPLLAIGALLLRQQSPVILLLLLGLVANWLYQKGRNAYYFLPFLSILALLAAQVPINWVPWMVLGWCYAQFWQMENLRLCMHHLITFFHFRKCELIEKIFVQFIEPGASLTMIGNFTCVWHMTNTTCPNPEILGWGSNSFLSLHGRKPEWYSEKTWHVPVPWTDYALSAVVKNPADFVGVWYTAIAGDQKGDIVLFQHLRRTDKWSEIRESLLTQVRERGIILPDPGGTSDEENRQTQD